MEMMMMMVMTTMETMVIVRRCVACWRPGPGLLLRLGRGLEEVRMRVRMRVRTWMHLERNVVPE